MLVSDASQVSIAIRAFRRDWLAEAIESVLAQTHRHLELVIYDETGGLADIAGRYEVDQRVRYHRGEPQPGPSGRFRAAWSLCRGDYIGMLDDDDRYQPEFVAHMLSALAAEPTAGVAFCRTGWMLGGGRMVTSDPLPSGLLSGTASALLACHLSVASSRMLIRRAAIEAAERRQPMPGDVAPDLWMMIQTALAGWTHLAVGDRLVVQRWHADQLSRRDEGDLPVATFGALVVDDPELERIRRATLARHLVRRALFRLRAGDRKAAREDLSEARHADASVLAAARRAIGIAARLPLAGPLAARAAVASPSLRRRRALPPGRPAWTSGKPDSPGPRRGSNPGQ